MTLTEAGPVAVPELHHGDIIHVQPHEVFQHTPWTHTVTCREADVEVDVLLPVGSVIVVCWGDCHGTCGAVVYDADDCVLRVAVAHEDTPGWAAA